MTYQIDEAPHSIFMGADALTRVKASLCHFSPDCVHLWMTQKDCSKDVHKQAEEAKCCLLWVQCAIVAPQVQNAQREETA